MILVDRSNVEKLWPHMVSGLVRAEYQDQADALYTVDDLLGLIINQEMLGYFQPESGYSGVMVINQYPRDTVLCTFFGGKDPENSTPINLEALDEFLVKVAKVYDCSRILVEGRKGWEKWTKPLGYSTSNVLLYKRI